MSENVTRVCRYCQWTYEESPLHRRDGLDGYCSKGCYICGRGIDDSVGRHVPIEEWGDENLFVPEREPERRRRYSTLEQAKALGDAVWTHPVALMVTLAKVFYNRAPDGVRGRRVTDKAVAELLMRRFRPTYSEQAIYQQRVKMAKMYPALKRLIYKPRGK